MMVANIQIDNIALKYIDQRIEDNEYRGSVSSEHNRYDRNEIHDILYILNKYAPNKKLLQIRDTDLSKRAANTPEEYDYAKFCNEVKSTVERGKGTQDSIRKNIFVDLHRMGLLARYNKKKKQLAPYQRGKVKFVAITDLGIRFLQENIVNQQFIFSKALDKLLGGYLEIALELLKDYDIDYITKYEFMFFVSAVNSKTSFNISVEDCVTLIKEYRKLSPMQCKSVVETLKEEMNPKLTVGNKTNKRDWHNWQNKIDQLYHLFNQTIYFDVFGPQSEKMKLILKTITTKTGETVDIRKRSVSTKFCYFKKHCVKKEAGFQLHHVFPLSWAESPEQYKLFDSWENLVYIDAFTHAKITQNKNRNVKMTKNKEGIVLSDFVSNSVELKYMTNIIYNLSLQSTMLSYNDQLLNSLSM